MSVTFEKAAQAIIGLLSIFVLNACGNGGAQTSEEHGKAQAEEYERGPHRGRMLRDGGFAVEITIFEDGVDPEFHIYSYLNEKPVSPSTVDLSVELTRLGGRVDRFAFTPQDDYLLGNGVVKEPHSFDVMVRAAYQGEQHEWSYDSYEGRTTIKQEQADAAGVEVEIAGPATIVETIPLSGRIGLLPQGRAEVSAWFPGRIVEMTKTIGDRVEKGEILARVLANESLQTYEIPALISGVVTEQYANTGDVATIDHTLYIIANPAKVLAEFFVYPRDAERLRSGQKVTVQSLNGEYSLDAEIETVLPSADIRTQTIIAHAHLPNENLIWRPGQAVEGIVVVGEEHVPLAVKTEGLQRFRDFTVVYARVGETYEVRMLDLGRRTPEWTEVLGGIDPGIEYVAKNAFLIRQDVEKSGASHDH